MCWPCCDTLFVYGYQGSDTGDYLDGERWSLRTGLKRSDVVIGGGHPTVIESFIYAIGLDGKFYVRNFDDGVTSYLARLDKNGVLELEYALPVAVPFNAFWNNEHNSYPLFSRPVITHSDGSITVFYVSDFDTIDGDYVQTHPHEIKFDVNGAVLWENWIEPQGEPLVGTNHSDSYKNPVLNSDDSIWVSVSESVALPAPPNNRANPILARIDPDDGSEQTRFTSTVGTRGEHSVYPIAAFSDGSFLAATSYNEEGIPSNQPGAGRRIIKYSGAGAVLWNTLLEFAGVGTTTKAEIDADGNSYVTAWFSKTQYAGDGITYDEFRTTKINASGVIQWSRTLTDSSTDNRDGNVLLSMDRQGNTYHGIGYNDTSGNFPPLNQVTSYDAAGDPRWTQTYDDRPGYPRNLYARKGTYPLG